MTVTVSGTDHDVFIANPKLVSPIIRFASHLAGDFGSSQHRCDPFGAAG